MVINKNHLKHTGERDSSFIRLSSLFSFPFLPFLFSGILRAPLFERRRCRGPRQTHPMQFLRASHVLAQCFDPQLHLLYRHLGDFYLEPFLLRLQPTETTNSTISRFEPYLSTSNVLRAAAEATCASVDYDSPPRKRSPWIPCLARSHSPSFSLSCHQRSSARLPSSYRRHRPLPIFPSASRYIFPANRTPCLQRNTFFNHLPSGATDRGS